MAEMVIVLPDGTEATFDGNRWRVDDDPEIEGLLGAFFIHGSPLVLGHPEYCPNELYLPAYAAVEFMGGLIEKEPEIPTFDDDLPLEQRVVF